MLFCYVVEYEENKKRTKTRCASASSVTTWHSGDPGRVRATKLGAPNFIGAFIGHHRNCKSL